MTEDFGFDNLDLAENADPRVPVVLVLDASDSMEDVRPGEQRSPLEALNGGLDKLVSSLRSDPLARRRAEVSFVVYGTEPAEPTPFATVDDLVLPELSPMGVTATGAALEAALDHLEARKAVYKENGIQYYRPICLLVSDGLPTSDITTAANRIKEYTEKKKLTFFPVAVEGADMDSLQSLSGKQPLKLQGVKFDELFQWLSASAASVSASQPGDRVAAPSPEGWAEL